MLCNVSSGKGDCPESFYSVGDKHTKPALVHCWFQLHKTFFFLGGTHHKAVRRSSISFLSVSLTCAFCSQPHTHTHSKTGYTHTHTNTHMLAHSLRDFHPLHGRGIPLSPCETTPLQANWHCSTSSEHNASASAVIKSIHTWVDGSSYWSYLHNVFSVGL